MRWAACGVLLGFASCQQDRAVPGESTKVITPARVIAVTDTALHNRNGTWFYKNRKATAVIVEQKGPVVTARLPVIDGKENGLATGWYPTSEKRFERRYQNGNREGRHQTWYKNGRLAGENVFRDDKYEGPQVSYFESGHRWQRLNYVKGYEEGKQKTWNDNGLVINNFTIKNGKLYGVIGRYDCMSVMQK
ncbi:toxin-antitoxin system YwqK family antitoxin [Hymenobacter artigasi]|uniref:Antitoxin component YwqK of YwqJK toxin-antitoxin module n=1 Tax=Hymenobacter artigasi TaxID=2719616 RepID=A0ABX1HPM8_9BACT|nr:hypothetical protein [Hymenobacter artigasi]NKI91001.1 antitoxin component YwqK of YwqJK toxin-antitoxin module [Hymenobacter artigasi]